jgi:hypothetical protein
MMKRPMLAIHRGTGRTVAHSSREAIPAMSNLSLMMTEIATIPAV